MTTPPTPQQRTLAVNPEVVIERLGTQVGHLVTELTMKDLAIEGLHARIAELEGAAAEADQP